jgi:dolichyl-diphosphooligosaccharide--protein glycosyltransferase
MNDSALVDSAARPAPATAVGRSEWVRGGALATVLLLAILPRLSGLTIVFSRGELLQWDGDSAYHLKRILFAIGHFPGLPRFDPAMNWPAGAVCPWADGFDLLAAAWGLLAGLGDPARATMAALGFTTILGLLAVWAAIDLARLVMPDGPARESAALAAGLLTAVIPSGVYLSQLGFLDHHVAELLSFLLLAGWALRRHPRADAPTVTGLAWELGGALTATFAVWVYSGGVLYVGMAAAIVLAALLRDERPTLVGSGLPALATAAAAVALLSIPAIRAHGHLLSYRYPSLLQPLLLAVAAAVLALAWAASRRAHGFGRRLALLLVAGMVATLALAVTVPEAAHEFRAGLEGWLLRRDPWIASIAEFQPFGWDSATFLSALFDSYGAVGVGAPLLLAAGSWAVIRGAGSRGVAFVVLSAVFVALSLHQVRFERIGQPLLMIFTAATLAAFAHRRRPHANLTAVRLFPVLGTLVLIFADPSLRSGIRARFVRVPPAASAALALRDEAGGRHDQGVLTSWGDGHLVNFLSGLPTPTNGFGSYLDEATFLESEEVFAKDGPALDGLLKRRSLRYVIAGALTSELASPGGASPFAYVRGSRAGAVLNLDQMRRRTLSSLLIGGSGIPGAAVPHLEHLMPVFGTSEQPAWVSFPLPALWVYERVAGAHVRGAAPPGKRVVASLDFREQGRPHVWKAFAEADAGGHFELVLPFPTRFLRPALSSSPRYSLRAGDGAAIEIEVPEAVVRAGGSIQVGTIAGGT